MAIVMDFEGKIKGSSIVQDHEEWIPVQSISNGVHRAISGSGAVKDRNTATPSFEEVALQRLGDASSNELAYQAMVGKTICNIMYIRVVNVNDGKVQVQQETALKDPIISSYNTQRSGDEQPYESLTINFTAFAIRWNEFEEGKTPKEGKWQGVDLASIKPWTPA